MEPGAVPINTSATSGAILEKVASTAVVKPTINSGQVMSSNSGGEAVVKKVASEAVLKPTINYGGVAPGSSSGGESVGTATVSPQMAMPALPPGTSFADMVAAMKLAQSSGMMPMAAQPAAGQFGTIFKMAQSGQMAPGDSGQQGPPMIQSGQPALRDSGQQAPPMMQAAPVVPPVDFKPSVDRHLAALKGVADAVESKVPQGGGGVFSSGKAPAGTKAAKKVKKAIAPFDPIRSIDEISTQLTRISEAIPNIPVAPPAEAPTNNSESTNNSGNQGGGARRTRKARKGRRSTRRRRN